MFGFHVNFPGVHTPNSHIILYYILYIYMYIIYCISCISYIICDILYDKWYMICYLWYTLYDHMYIYIWTHDGLIFPTKPILIKQVQAALAGLRHTLCFCLYCWELSPSALNRTTGLSTKPVFITGLWAQVWGPKLWVRAPSRAMFFLGWNPQMNGESDELYWWNDWNGSHTQHTVVFISGDQVTSLTGDSSLWENSPLDTPCSSPAKSAGTASLTLQQKLLRKIMEHQDSTARRVDR